MLEKNIKYCLNSEEVIYCLLEIFKYELDEYRLSEQKYFDEEN